MSKWAALKETAIHFGVSEAMLYKVVDDSAKREQFKASGCLLKMGRLWKFNIDAIEKRGGLS